MKIIEPSAHIIHPVDGIESLRTIESMARISHKSENRQTENSWERFIETVVIQHGDWSVTEHVSVKVLIRTDRGITHELVRHRLFSFTQESTRFVNGRKSYPDGLEFIKPLKIGEGTVMDPAGINYDIWEESVRNSEEQYFKLLDLGVRPQEARSVLPNALASTIVMTGNLRSWRWFFLARTTMEAHPDMRRITIPLLLEFKEKFPLLYEDIHAFQKQSISMAKVH